MSIRILFLLVLLAGTTHVIAQQSVSLKEVMTLSISRSGGANGAGVAWHPVQKKYYASMAGNSSFPFVVFDSKGILLSSEDQNALEDIRGIWYNPDAKTIQANCYDTRGWIEYKLDKNGNPLEMDYVLKGMVQPGQQSAGAYDPVNKWVIFLDQSGYVAAYHYPDGEQVKEFPLHLGKTAGNDDENGNEDVVANYNSTTMIFTGIKKAELGVLNVTERRVELYDMETGYMTRILKLPEDAPVNNWLNFSYANGIVFLFDKDSRIWKGYK